MEAKKWQWAIQKVQALSFWQSLKAVLSGLSISQLFPYRTGEFLGRLVYIKNDNRVTAALISAMVSWTQLAATLLFGLLAFLMLQPVQLPYVLLWSLLGLVLVFMLGLKYSSSVRSVLDWSVLKAFKEAYQVLPKGLWLKVFGLSLLRYFSFVLPYAYLVQWFGIGAYDSLFMASAAVATVYLLQTLGPSFILTDLAIRVSVPVLVFSAGVSNTEQLDFLPGIIIYVFNVVLPMIFGALVLLTLKLKP